MWEPRKLAKLTMQLWREGKVSGLFLSSSVCKDPDQVTELQLDVLRALRNGGYSGYIHLRIMPGISFYYIREAVELADRVGINLEAPSEDAFSELCPDKGGFKESIVKRLVWITREVQRARQRTPRPRFGFAKAGVDTQLIVGATGDSDLQFLQVTEWLYKKQSLKRVYYSGFEPITQTPLEKRNACPPWREHRLYQCSYLIRDYNFRTDHLGQIVNDEGFLSNTDPKLAFAKANPDMFPIDLNNAFCPEIVRIPRVGPVTAKRILRARENRQIHHSSDLEKAIGAKLCRRISQYVELKDKKLTDF
jgi:predicted DNA-binding helix-hairpin-helix protein